MSAFLTCYCRQFAARLPVPVAWGDRNESLSSAIEFQFRCVGSLRMRAFGWTPSIVPNGDDQNVYLVVDDFAHRGRAWREADTEKTDLETVVSDLLSGQYNDPIRVVAFNTAENWSQDVSADIAQELRRRCDLQMRDIPFFLQDFVDKHEGRYRDVQLPLPMRLF